MTFREIPLYEAVYHARGEVDSPGAESWTLHRQEELCRLVQKHLPIEADFTKREMLDAWVTFRKSPGKKIETKVLVALAHGRQCFFQNRGVGPCSEDVDLDRLIPGVRGGTYSIENCILACSFHNRQRNDRPLEEYLNV